MKYIFLLKAILIVSSLNIMAQDSTATIHFYRTNSIKGAIVTYQLYYNNALVGDITPGTIIHYTVKPGVNKFTAKTESEEFIFINTKPSEEYFVRCSVAMGMLVGRPKFQVVSKKEGDSAIKKIEGKKTKSK
jgi:hypothetical protein